MLVRPTSRQRGTFARSVIASVAIVAIGPQVLVAQEAAQQPASESKTHTVKRGDTLWDLAKAYLGDAFLWPEIYRLNTGVIEDPHWIYPGEQLKLPGDHTKVVAAAPPAASSPAPTAPAPAAAPVQPAEPPLAFAAAPRDTSTPMLQARKTAVRVGEYIAAPWVDRDGGPRGAGSVIEAVDLPGVATAEHSRLQLHDRVFVVPPSGPAPAPHALFLTYRLGPFIEDFGQIVIPTGVVEVSQPGNAGEATVGQVVRMFGEIRMGQNLIALDSGTANVVGRPNPVNNGRRGIVRWIAESPVLASLQSYVVIDISQREGVATGDQIELYKPREAANDDHALALPEIAIAHAQVLRVTPYGATAIITEQEQPKIQKGTTVRIAAKMP